MRRVVNIFLVVAAMFLSAAVAYYWCHRVSLIEVSLMVNKVQANSAFNRIVDEQHIIELIKRNCIKDALKMIESDVEDQKRALANFVQEGVGPDFVKYVEDRAPGLLASARVRSDVAQHSAAVQCAR